VAVGVPDWLEVMDAVWEALEVMDAVAPCELVWVEVPVLLGVMEAVAVCEGVPVVLLEAVLDGVGLSDGVSEGVADEDGVMDGVAVALREAVTVDVRLGT